MIMVLLMGIAMALVGMGLSVWGVLHYRRNSAQYSDAVKRWSKSQATVQDARLVERERTDSNDNSSTVYEPRLRYSFIVGANVHEGERINLCNELTFYDPVGAEQWLAAHAVGASIELYYDPVNPENSACTLDRPNFLRAIFTGTAGLGVTAMGIYVLVNVR